MAHNCTSVPIIKTFEREQTNKSKLLRKVITVKKQIKQFLNVPLRVEVVRLSNKNVVTEIRHYQNRREIKVKTEINNRYLLPIN